MNINDKFDIVSLLKNDAFQQKLSITELSKFNKFLHGDEIAIYRFSDDERETAIGIRLCSTRPKGNHFGEGYSSHVAVDRIFSCKEAPFVVTYEESVPHLSDGEGEEITMGSFKKIADAMMGALIVQERGTNGYDLEREVVIQKLSDRAINRKACLDGSDLGQGF